MNAELRVILAVGLELVLADQALGAEDAVEREGSVSFGEDEAIALGIVAAWLAQHVLPKHRHDVHDRERRSDMPDAGLERLLDDPEAQPGTQRSAFSQRHAVVRCHYPPPWYPSRRPSWPSLAAAYGAAANRAALQRETRRPPSKCCPRTLPASLPSALRTDCRRAAARWTRLLGAMFRSPIPD